MADEKISMIRALMSIGVWWYVWPIKGFWYGVLYGLFWPVWVGFRMAEWLMNK